MVIKFPIDIAPPELREKYENTDEPVELEETSTYEFECPVCKTHFTMFDIRKNCRNSCNNSDFQ